MSHRSRFFASVACCLFAATAIAAAQQAKTAPPGPYGPTEDLPETAPIPDLSAWVIRPPCAALSVEGLHRRNDVKPRPGPSHRRSGQPTRRRDTADPALFDALLNNSLKSQPRK